MYGGWEEDDYDTYYNKRDGFALISCSVVAYGGNGVIIAIDLRQPQRHSSLSLSVILLLWGSFKIPEYYYHIQVRRRVKGMTMGGRRYLSVYKESCTSPERLQ